MMAMRSAISAGEAIPLSASSRRTAASRRTPSVSWSIMPVPAIARKISTSRSSPGFSPEFPLGVRPARLPPARSAHDTVRAAPGRDNDQIALKRSPRDPQTHIRTQQMLHTLRAAHVYHVILVVLALIMPPTFLFAGRAVKGRDVWFQFCVNRCDYGYPWWQLLCIPAEPTQYLRQCAAVIRRTGPKPAGFPTLRVGLCLLQSSVQITKNSRRTPP